MRLHQSVTFLPRAKTIISAGGRPITGGKVHDEHLEFLCKNKVLQTSSVSSECLWLDEHGQADRFDVTFLLINYPIIYLIHVNKYKSFNQLMNHLKQLFNQPQYIIQGRICSTR